ncbi:MAG: outer membrane lipoprotein chaperone LolA [Gemmatimonadales bacterium]
MASLSAYPPIRPSAQDPWPILDHASRAYAAVRDLSADFVQVIDNPMIGGPDTTRGRLFIQKPNYFAMRFTEPRGDRIVADGQHLWLYTPSSTPGQVIRSAIPGTGTTGPNLIAQFVEQPRERYQARYVRADSLADAVTLTPRDTASELPYSEATVWVDRTDGMIRRLEIVEASGQRRTVILRGVAVNRGVARSEFRFSPPAGSRVVRQ